jgi:phage terminase Nu1 subunit (DNA packaging protein)
MNKAEPKDPTGRITQAELARRLKVSRPSVSKAVKAGRITSDDDGLFDPIEAELQWVSNTRANARGKRKPAAGGYAEARGRKESALARMAELRLAQAEGNLIERSAVDFTLDDLGATLRGLLENLPDRLAPQVFQRQTLAEVHSIITEAGHDVLLELSAAMERRAKELDAGTPSAA